ncbi:hypothetical protein GMRT_10158 [Giardia muris]|uniref:Uncharacterized protein n=1 Tax=Giardia muris TaxID=5742 RepID=A0A4Z1SYM7_GIAMU|nr:hypothetical protein GMRT_10158 [Giardia muris]|eukprot:TNJ26773.1 hypothetical protein GMRT_10158 [Giardia muris]
MSLPYDGLLSPRPNPWAQMGWLDESGVEVAPPAPAPHGEPVRLTPGEEKNFEFVDISNKQTGTIRRGTVALGAPHVPLVTASMISSSSSDSLLGMAEAVHTNDNEDDTCLVAPAPPEPVRVDYVVKTGSAGTLPAIPTLDELAEQIRAEKERGGVRKRAAKQLRVAPAPRSGFPRNVLVQRAASLLEGVSLPIAPYQEDAAANQTLMDECLAKMSLALSSL